MIKADFYPSVQTIADMELTDTINNLNLTGTEDPMVAYYMGKNIGSILRTGEFVCEGSGSSRTYKLNPSTEGIYWGWTQNTSGQGTTKTIQWNGSKWVSTSRFINEMKAYKMGMYNGVGFNITGDIYDFSNEEILGNGERIRTCLTNTHVTGTLTTQDLFAINKGAAQLTFTLPDSTTESVWMSSWDNDKWRFDLGNNRYLYVTSIQWASGANYNATYFNGNQMILNAILSAPIDTAVDPDFNGRVFMNIFPYNIDARLRIDTDRFYTGITKYGGTSLTIDPTEAAPTQCRPFEVSYIAANYAATLHNGNYYYVLTRHDDLMHNSGSDQVYINCYIDLKGFCEKATTLFPKTATNQNYDTTPATPNPNSAEYEPSDAVPIFAGRNNPVGWEKPPRYSDIEPVLQPWQKYGASISDDDFDPEESPSSGGDPDNPEDPTKDDGKDDGDPPVIMSYSAQLGMTKFVAMTGITWGQFAQQLAASIATTTSDPTNTNTFAYLLGTFKKDSNGIINEAADDWSIFRFIASARFYPFDLASLVTAFGGDVLESNAEAQVYFGYRGASVAAGNRPLKYSVVGLRPVTIHCPNKSGSMDIESCTFEDFEPYTKYTLMLPFIGEMVIPAHNAVCATIHVLYQIDFSSGTCSALVMCDGGFNKEGETIGIMSGQCSTSVSIDGNDIVAQGDQMAAAQLNKASSELNLLRSETNFAFGAAGATKDAVTAGATSPDKVGAVMNSLFNSAPKVLNAGMDIAAAGINDKMANLNLTKAQRSVPFTLNWGSNVTGSSRMDRPYLRVERMLIVRPQNYKHVFGYPTCKAKPLSAVQGYFECANPDLSGIGTSVALTKAEQKLLSDALRQGSYMK